MRLSKKVISLPVWQRMRSRVKTHSYQVIDSLSSQHSVTLLLEAANVSRSGFYKWRCKKNHSRLSENHEIRLQIKAIHTQYPFYGYRRITAALHRSGTFVNHKRVYRLMKTLGLQSTIRKKRRHFGRKGSTVFPNLLNRDFASAKPKQKLATDVTYLPVISGFLYLSAVQDLHNNEIVSYKIGKKNSLQLVLETLTPLKKTISEKTVLHSDQGFQYTSKHYKQRLEEMGLQGSHSRKENV